jgi:hypothetical protein
MLYTLGNCLFEEGIQRDIIRRGASAMYALSKSVLPLSELIGPYEERAIKKSKAKDAVYFEGPFTERSNHKESFDRVAGFLQQVSGSEYAPLLFTWCVICVFYMFPKARQLVLGDTRQEEWHMYFDEFGGGLDARLQQYLCGLVTYNRTVKSSTILKQAKTPIEIVIAEWQSFYKLQVH